MVVFDRIYQVIMRVATCFLPWREPEVIEGEGCLEKLPSIIQSKNISNVLVVTDGALSKLGLLDPFLNSCQKLGLKYSLYDKTVPNPTIANVNEAYKMYKENGCQAIVAFGGGSSMDCAKGAGALVVRPNKTVNQLKGLLKIHKKIPTFFAVPTTAGTGSETTLAAVITDEKTHYKYPINDPSLFPDYAVLDPLVTVNLPPHITSTTGMDALCHAVEAYIGRSNTKKTERCAREAITLIFDNLLEVYSNPTNIQARQNMQKAAYLAGVAFTRAYVGYVHAIAHSLGGQYGVPHGLANAIIMPYVFTAFGSKAYKRLAQLCELVHLDKEGDTEEQKAKRFIDAISQLNAKMNIPTSIPQIKDEDIPLLVKHAMSEGIPLYPVPRILSKAEFTDLYKQIKVGK